MEKPNFRMESGLQLLTRLSTKKTKVENFYRDLFQSGLKPGDVVEIFSNRSSSFLLIDMVCDALLPIAFGGTGIGVIILNTDGHITLQALTTLLKKKINSRYYFNSSGGEDAYSQMFQEMLDNLYILDVFDATQLYNTIHSLDNVLRKHSNISLCVIDTFTAFYWSEQTYKITKMDVYLKNLLRILQNAVQGQKLTILYTRPEYFNSSKYSLQSLEACVETPTTEKNNYRVQLLYNDDDTFSANVMTCNNIIGRNFRVENNVIVWL